ncbi:response regulator [Holdemania massiliensis]|uniref:response regulator n=1 Tax=Holdemania massiliensis TaxID=1468449 RepID=UPI001F058736|nr:response regulator transcription factor [Holdemania massiliensis]MCH1939437.1 response regulator transcription factor [Holdemania massiliensis]
MNSFTQRILIVEDDPQIRNFISYVLSAEGFNSDNAATAQSAMTLLAANLYDLMLLDLGLPDYDGMDVIRKVREWSEIPIIVVSARDQDQEKAEALDSGADDYLTKPFSTTELMARIRVAIRHAFKQNAKTAQKKLTVQDLSLDLEKHQVTLRGEALHLTPMEYNLLSLFLRNSGKVLTTRYLITHIWGSGYGEDTQALRALMAGLRRKIEENPAKPRYIVTEIGVGYRLVDQESQKG